MSYDTLQCIADCVWNKAKPHARHRFIHGIMGARLLPNSNRPPTAKLSLRPLQLGFQHRTLPTLHSLHRLRQ
jgi:hypothetical protein